MRILGCYIVWNEEDFLALSMRSIQPLVDGYCVVDGNLIGFAPDMPVGSVDRTVEIAKRFPNTKVIQLEEPLSECDKRELYLKEEADWYVVIDADDVMYGDVRRLKHELSYGRGFTSVDVPLFASFSDLWSNHSRLRCTVIHKDAGFHYGSHHWVRLNKDNAIIEGRGWKPDFVKVLCLRELRTEERVKQKQAYMLWRSRNPNVRF